MSVRLTSIPLMPPLGVALVTGAARGIGRAIAVRLAKDGFNIALNDLQSTSNQLDIVEKEITGYGRKTTTIFADVRSDSEVKSMVDDTIAKLGTLDVMVANAGIGAARPLVDVDVDEWDEVLAVNGRGVFLCYKYAAKQMISQGRGGRIIGASSVFGKQGAPFCSAYSASKFAVRGLTQSAARELAPHGITVNAYSPGAISTDMINHMDSSELKAVGLSPDMIPLQRHATTDEVAGLVSYLVSPDASYITGQSVSINGGLFSD